MAPVIHAHAIVHRYGDRVALDGFGLDVPAGSVFGLLGPNGSGKSTFVSLVAAMEPLGEGTLQVFGQEPSPALRARVGTVFQENGQDPLMTPAETTGLAARLFGIPRAEARQRGDELLARFGLRDRARDPISTLSGGMRRRLEMARALMHDPDLLLLDEPTTGVDPGERRALWEALGEAAGDGGERTILLASNDLAEADQVCDLVAFIDAGAVAAVGSPSDLKRGLRAESVRVNWPSATDEDLRAIASWPGASDIVREGDELRLTVDSASALIPRLFELAPGAIRSVSIEPSTLEDAYFRHVRGRAAAPAEVPA
ncbi:MAG: ATP-binding cassette domain-containing protein [Tepidiformaceae bacterium]